MLRTKGLIKEVQHFRNVLRRGKRRVCVARPWQQFAAHGPALAGKIVVDAGNRMGGGPMNSAAAFVAHAPGAQIYRAFNSLGWENFANPQFGEV